MKITVVGAGDVGTTIANLILTKGLATELILIDVEEGKTKGKALDLLQTSTIEMFDTRIKGVIKDYDATANSEIVVITAGQARKPGMSRDDLIATNAYIVKDVTHNLQKYSPNAKIILVTNPLDVMTYVACLTATGKPLSEIMGMTGIDVARYKTFIAEELNISAKSINAVILGGHGDTMVPLPRYTTVESIPVNHFLTEDKLEMIIDRTKKGGSELFDLMGKSACYAPSSAVVQIIESIVKDSKRILQVCAYLNGQYGLNDLCLSVPAVIGRNGVESVIEVELNEQEQELLMKSARAIKALIRKLENLMIL